MTTEVQWKNWRGMTFVTCPDCEMSAPIDETHTIGPDGYVQPSLVCGNCDFHEMVRLADYG